MNDSEQQMDIKVSRGPGLAGRGDRPRRGVETRADEPASNRPAWDWSTDEVFGAELAELRGSVSALRAQVAELERAARRAAARETELRTALGRLAGAGLRERRRLKAELRGQGLL